MLKLQGGTKKWHPGARGRLSAVAATATAANNAAWMGSREMKTHMDSIRVRICISLRKAASILQGRHWCEALEHLGYWRCREIDVCDLE